MTAKELIESYWHGTASGDLRGGLTGLHVGTRQAAEDALHATIGFPVEGDWDGTREYGQTKLCGKNTLKERGIFPTGFNCGHSQQGYTTFPDEDFYPTEYSGRATFSNGELVPFEAKPDIFELDIIGKMSNHPGRPHGDWQANGRMAGLLKRGKARRGYFYKNQGEDSGSISAVLPSQTHILKKKPIS